MLSVYRVSSSSFIDVPNENTFVIFQLTTDDLFYAKVNDNGVISVVLLGSGGTLTGYLQNNIVIPTTEFPVTLSSNETALHSIQLGFDATATLLDFPNLTTLFFLGFNTTLIGDVSLPTITGTLSVISIRTCPNITLIELPNITDALVCNVENCSQLTSIDLSLLQTIGTVTINYNENLTQILFTSLSTCRSFKANDNALNQSVVDNILLQLDNNGVLNGVCDLSKGTNSAPTGGAANVNVVSLQGKGWTVEHN